MRIGKNKFSDIVPAFIEINRGREASSVFSLKSVEKGSNVDRLGKKQNSKAVTRNLFDMDIQTHSMQLKRKHSNSSKQLFAKAHSTQKGETFLRPKAVRSVSDFKPSLIVSESKENKVKELVPQQMSQMLSSKLKESQRDRKSIMKQVLADLQKRQSKLFIKREYGRLKQERSILEQSIIKNKAFSHMETKSKLMVESSKDERQVDVRQLLAQSTMFDGQMNPSVYMGGDQMLKTIKEAIRSNIQQIYLQKDRRLQQKYESKERQFLQKFSNMEKVIGQRLQNQRNILMESISSLHKKQDGFKSVDRDEKLSLMQASKHRIERNEGYNDDKQRMIQMEGKQRKLQPKREIVKIDEQTIKDKQRRVQTNPGQVQRNKGKGPQFIREQNHNIKGIRQQQVPHIIEKQQPVGSQVLKQQQQNKQAEKHKLNKTPVTPPPEKMKLKQYPRESKPQSSIFDNPDNSILDEIEQITLNCQSKIIPPSPKPSPRIQKKEDPKKVIKPKEQPEIHLKNRERNNSKDKDNPPTVVSTPKETKQPQKQPNTQVIPPKQANEPHKPKNEPPKPANEPPSLQQKQQFIRKKIKQFQQRDPILGSIGCVAGLCSQNCKQSKIQWRLPALLTYRYVLDCFLDQIPYYEQAEKLGLISNQISDSFFSDFEKMEANLEKMMKAFTKKGVISEPVRVVMASEENEMYRLRPMIVQEVVKYVRQLRRSEEVKNLGVLQCGLRMINAVFLIRQISDYPNQQGLPVDFQSYDLQRSLSLFGVWFDRLQKL